MKYTSAEASKLLRQLNEDYISLCSHEAMSCEFLASLGEDVESVRPEYDFTATQTEMEKLKNKIRVVKHAINVFNCTHTVPGFDMTVDAMLVLIPQLTKDKSRLASMKDVLPKVRESVAGYGKATAVIDYKYANYNINDATAEYNRVSELLSKAQTALDVLNSTETMEIDF